MSVAAATFALSCEMRALTKKDTARKAKETAGDIVEHVVNRRGLRCVLKGRQDRGETRDYTAKSSGRLLAAPPGEQQDGATQMLVTTTRREPMGAPRVCSGTGSYR